MLTVRMMYAASLVPGVRPPPAPLRTREPPAAIEVPKTDGIARRRAIDRADKVGNPPSELTRSEKAVETPGNSYRA